MSESLELTASSEDGGLVVTHLHGGIEPIEKQNERLKLALDEAMIDLALNERATRILLIPLREIAER